MAGPVRGVSVPRPGWTRHQRRFRSLPRLGSSAARQGATASGRFPTGTTPCCPANTSSPAPNESAGSSNRQNSLAWTAAKIRCRAEPNCGPHPVRRSAAIATTRTPLLNHGIRQQRRRCHLAGGLPPEEARLVSFSDRGALTRASDPPRTSPATVPMIATPMIWTPSSTRWFAIMSPSMKSKSEQKPRTLPTRAPAMPPIITPTAVRTTITHSFPMCLVYC